MSRGRKYYKNDEDGMRFATKTAAKKYYKWLGQEDYKLTEYETEKPEKTPDIKVRETKGFYVITKSGKEFFKKLEDAQEYVVRENYKQNTGAYITQGTLITLYSDGTTNRGKK